MAEITRVLSAISDRFPTIKWPLFPKRFTKRFWVSVTGACDYCEAINEINSEGVDYAEGVFELPNGGTKGGPPAHRYCRCTVIIR